MTSTTVETPSASRTSWWNLLKQAVRGTDQDYTEGSLGRAVFLLSVPMILEMLMESAFGILDVFFVGRLGPDAVAAVGITESLLTVVFAVAMGLSMSTTALVARRIGEKQPEDASRTAVQAVGLGFACAVPVMIAGICVAARVPGHHDRGVGGGGGERARLPPRALENAGRVVGVLAPSLGERLPYLVETVCA